MYHSRVSETRGLTRRRFLQAAGATTVLAAGPSLGAAGANEQIRLGVIGCGGRANSLTTQFSGIPGAKVVALSDPDTAQMDALVAKVRGRIKDFAPDQHQVPAGSALAVVKHRRQLFVRARRSG